MMLAMLVEMTFAVQKTNMPMLVESRSIEWSSSTLHARVCRDCDSRSNQYKKSETNTVNDWIRSKEREEENSHSVDQRSI